ncbi:MAG: hypothetical protein HON43_02825 [Alphaproteobacteria bacterium]|jgi:cardiolipin synthase A/B|nr:hypothetical protein [Alphaproteobacteria bacterium]MBT5390396.1 hypothetical protein [Alphaproteobacteria bacterium]
MIKIPLIALCSLLFILPCVAKNNQKDEKLIVYPDKAHTQILDEISKAKKTIDISVYHLKDPKLVDLLIKKKNDKVAIRIITDSVQYDHAFNKANATDAYKKLRNAGIPVRSTPAGIQKAHPKGHYHAKFILIDDTKLLLTSGNFDETTFDYCRDFGVILEAKSNPKEIESLKSLFLSDWENRPASVTKDSSLLVGPEGQRKKLIEFLLSAKKSLNVYQQYLNDPEILKTLATVLNRGVNVHVLMMPFPTGYDLDPNVHAQNFLKESGAKVKLVTGYYVHTKLIIVDEEIALMGSVNLAQSAIDENREVSIFLTGSVVKQILSTFRWDWSEALSLAAGRKYALKKKTDWNQIFRKVL